MEQELRQRRKQEEMDWKDTRGAVYIAGKGQPSTSTITGNHDTICMQGLVQSARSPRHRGEVETPMYNQPPRGAQGHRLLGPAALRPCPFASRHGKVHAHLGPGGYCRLSGNGGPQTCLPAACGVAQMGAMRVPSSSTQDSRPSRGAKPREADETALPRAWPPQDGSRGGGEIKAGYLTRCP